MPSKIYFRKTQTALGKNILSREAKIITAIDLALTDKRGSLTPWDVEFLNVLRSAYGTVSSLSQKQKKAVRPLLKRLGLLSPSVRNSPR